MKEIEELAALLAADLCDIDRLEVEVIPPLDDTNLRIRAAQRGIEPDWPALLPLSILVRDGRSAIGLEFREGEDFAAQVENNLDHIQDFVAETTTEQWPPCPGHARRHALSPRAEAGRFGWYCPETGQLVAQLGRLLNPAP